MCDLDVMAQCMVVHGGERGGVKAKHPRVHVIINYDEQRLLYSSSTLYILLYYI